MPKTKTTTLSKSDFIRSLPSSTPAVDVIAKGKAVGLKLTKNYVYKVRTEINAKSSAKPVATALSSKKTTLSKSDFIRQHASLSTADVIAKAKTAGLKVSSSLVYMVRGRAGAKKAVAKKTSTAKTTAAPSKSPVTVSKADFVRARSHLSPKEIVEDAKAEGIKFEVGYVYNVRGADKAAVKKKRAAKKASKLAVTNGSAPSITATATSSEDLLRAVAAEIGLGRAIELLQGERARVSAILRA